MARRPQSAPTLAKPRVKVPAGSSKSFTGDTYTNFAASLGYGASNLTSAGTYSFTPISRNRTQLEWAYRSSWLVRVLVDCVAEDMTRERVSIESDMPPDRIDQLEDYMESLLLWQRISEAIKWSRLYGGCLAVLMIDGQKPDTPLRIEAVGKDQFRGLLILDRWMIWPHTEDPVKDLGKDYGKPKFYEVVSDARAAPHMKIHYSRCIRLDGVELPYWQAVAENYWGLSILEPLWDRLLAFDSATQGAAQLVYKCHLRTLKIEKLRELIAFGGDAYTALVQQIQQIRLYQANEGLTVLDAADEFETQTYGFGGLPETLIQFGQQLSGAAQIPLVRLFGQSPAGLNATGDSDIRNYYDMINSQQEGRLRRPLRMLFDLCHRSLFGEPLPDGFNFDFTPLWQLSDPEKSQVAGQVTQAVVAAQQAGIISNAAALKELRQSSKVTGIYSNITDEEIKDAELAPPPLMSEMAGDPTAAVSGREPGEQPGRETLFGGEKEPDPAGPPRPAVHAGHVPDLGLLPGHKSGIDTVEDIDDRYWQMRPLKSLKDVRRKFATADVHGLAVETDEAGRGTINGGGAERLACFVGDAADSRAVWAIERQDADGHFEDHEFALCFADRDAAVAAYKAAHGDEARFGAVRRMSTDALRRFVETAAAAAPQPLNGG